LYALEAPEYAKVIGNPLDKVRNLIKGDGHKYAFAPKEIKTFLVLLERSSNEQPQALEDQQDNGLEKHINEQMEQQQELNDNDKNDNNKNQFNNNDNGKLPKLNIIVNMEDQLEQEDEDDDGLFGLYWPFMIVTLAGIVFFIQKYRPSKLSVKDSKAILPKTQ
jgi:hypothetical protein